MRRSVLTPELVCSACAVVIDEIEYRLRLLKDVAPVVGRRLGADGSGVSKRLNPGRNEVNVADALEHACDLTQDYSVSGTGKGQRWVRINAREAGEAILIESATVEAESPQKLSTICSAFLDKHEDALWTELLRGDPDASIQDDFCMTYGPHPSSSFPSFQLPEIRGLFVSVRLRKCSVPSNVCRWLGSG